MSTIEWSLQLNSFTLSLDGSEGPDLEVLSKDTIPDILELTQHYRSRHSPIDTRNITKADLATTLASGTTKTDDGKTYNDEDLDLYLFYGAQSSESPGARFHDAVNDELKLFITDSGDIGVGHPDLEEGDVICILFGGRLPYILRPKEEQFTFLGECYFHGIMHGEAMDLWMSEGFDGREEEWFDLR